MIPQIRKLLPEVYGTYIEPFLGGGALLLDLEPTTALVGDYNHNIIELLEVIRDDCEQIITRLDSLKNTKEDFLRIRADVPTDKVDRATRLIYLNLYCFNGLYRENQLGEFNASYGYRKDRSIDSTNLRAVSSFFQNPGITLKEGDWKALTADAKPGDLVFLDPPYYPLDGKDFFTRYCKAGFKGKDLDSLYDEFVRLHKLGVHVVLANSYCPAVLAKFKEFNVVSVNTNYGISKLKRQAKQVEVLIFSYLPPALSPLP